MQLPLRFFGSLPLCNRGATNRERGCVSRDKCAYLCPNTPVKGVVHDSQSALTTGMTYILAVGTAVPEARLSQDETRDFFASQPGIDPRTARIIRAAFDHSGIENRYSVIGAAGSRDQRFADNHDILQQPSTGTRNEVYRQEAPALFLAAAQDALERAGVFASEVTHVVTASCTGFFAPGPDMLLISELGIRPTAERTHVGFMGCAAAFPALRIAAASCAVDPHAVVLVVCAELCSIHLRSSPDPEQIVASAVFADGAAAAVVSAHARRSNRPSLHLDSFSTSLTSTGAEDMQWTIGDHGFEMRLSAEVPRIIGREITGAVSHMLRQHSRRSGSGTRVPMAPNEITTWAVHPGGRSVLDRVESGLSLDKAALSTSRAVLRDFGNMSSATILFILQRILEDESLDDLATIASLCFGPGLTVETALLTRCAPPRTDIPYARRS